MSIDPERPALANHYSILVYPFLHKFKQGEDLSKFRSPSGDWQPWFERLNAEQIARVVDDTYFFLPYVRAVIYPEVKTLNASDSKDFTDLTRRNVDRRSETPTKFHSFRRQLIKKVQRRQPDPATVRRLTWRGSPAGRRWPLMVSIDDVNIAAVVHWIDALLFPSGLGLLLLKVELDETPQDLSRLIDLNYYLRLVQPPSLDWRMAQINLGVEASATLPEPGEIREWIDFWLKDLTESEHYTGSEPGQIYGERFHIFSYACVDGVASNCSRGLFEEAEDRLLYEYATCTRLGETIDDESKRPSPDEVKRRLAENRISIWNSWRGMALRESVVFLATGDIPFNRKALAHNIENDYLPLYLYALYQKYQLYLFSDELIRRGEDVNRNRREMRRLMQEFIAFRNRYWFSEVTRKPMGSTLYRSFQRGLETQELYVLVSDEIRELQSYFEARAGNRNGALLNILTFVLLPLSTLAGIFEMSFVTGSWKRFGISCGVVGVGMFFLWRWLSRRV